MVLIVDQSYYQVVLIGQFIVPHILNYVSKRNKNHQTFQILLNANFIITLTGTDQS